MEKHEVKIGDEIEWRGAKRTITKLVSVCAVLDGVDQVICLPVKASRISTWNDEVEEQRKERRKIRRAEALKLDPATAEIDWRYGYVCDPYGDEDLPDEMKVIGRNYFARRPGGDVWVSQHDWPRSILEAMHERINRGDFCEEVMVP